MLTVANLPRVVQEHGTMGTKANGKNAYEGGTTLRHESLPVSRRVKPPSPSPSIHSASNPGCPAVGVHSFEGTAAPGSSAQLVVWRASRQRPSPGCHVPQPVSAEDEDKMSSEQKADIVRRLRRCVSSLTWAVAIWRPLFYRQARRKLQKSKPGSRHAPRSFSRLPIRLTGQSSIRR